MNNGPILKDWQYYGFWLALAIAYFIYWSFIHPRYFSK